MTSPVPGTLRLRFADWHNAQTAAACVPLLFGQICIWARETTGISHQSFCVSVCVRARVCVSVSSSLDFLVYRSSCVILRELKLKGSIKGEKITTFTSYSNLNTRSPY